ncbi:MAG: hydrolase [Janthinobacterium lividum]
MATLDPRTTALVLIDLQDGIVAGDRAPRSGHAVVETSKNLAARFREKQAPVVLVHVGWRSEGEVPSRHTDEALPVPSGGTPPAFYAFVDGLREPDDVVVLKHHWGAFTGTDLDLQLRRRGVKTVVVAGIATNLGVESTVRSAWELSYDVVVVEDACTSFTAPMHAFAFEHILPRIARITSADDLTLGGE